MKTLRLAVAVALAALSAATATAATTPAGPAARPNIVILLADDMGFSDLGCYGGEIPTPNLDRLAAGGLRFTQFYNTGRCCPTRASLLTGLYPHQAGVGHMVEDNGLPGYRGFLNDRCVTLAEVLRGAGYFTAMTGKWHVGQTPEYWPRRRGFDRFYGSEAGGFYFRPVGPRKVIRDDTVLYTATNPPPEGWYSTDAWTDQAIGFVDEARAAGKPFFLYIAHNAPHFPLQAPPEDIARFRGKYAAGWDKLRQQRHARQTELGLVDRAWPLSPRPPAVPAWDDVRPQERERFDEIMAIYAACVERLDRSVGRLVAALQERGALDNTLLLFLSDNGGNAESGPNGRLEGPGAPGTADSTVFCGQSWATLQNTPFRRYKHFNHEGGIATPLIAHWPVRIRDAGQLRSQAGHVVDLMATCVEVSGAEYPARFNDRDIQPMEGRSLVPAFDNKPLARDALYWEHEGNAAIRAGDWKLVRMGRNGPWELYDLKSDRTELHDLASARPELTKQLAAKWEAWAERANVKPYPESAPAKKKAPARKKQAAR